MKYEVSSHRAARSRLAFNAQWTLALLVAGICSIWTRRGWARIAKAFLLWFGLIQKAEYVPCGTYDQRLSTCRNCPVFYAPLQTCGSPLKKELKGLGCWCYMPAAAKLAAKQCYIDEYVEAGYKGGWQQAASRSSIPYRAEPPGRNG